MTMDPIIIGAISGLAAGFVTSRITLFQVKKRTDDATRINKVASLPTVAAICAVSVILLAVIFGLYGYSVKSVEYALYALIALSIGVVDLVLKRIPNLSVLALLIVRLAAVVYELFSGASVKSALVPSLIGLVAAFILYQLPMFIGIPIGVGDVKFASAIGFCLGLFGFLEAAIIMAAGLLILLAVLTATKKGSVRTNVPMGPFLALGTVFTMIFPIFEKISQNVFGL